MQDNNIDSHTNDMNDTDDMNDCVIPSVAQANTGTKSRKRKYKTKAEKLEANRKSAADSRHRKKAVMMRLQQEVMKLRREKMLLQLENAKLKQMARPHTQSAIQSFDPLLMSSSTITNLRSQLGMVAGPVTGNIHNLQNSLKQSGSMISSIITSTNNQPTEDQMAKIRLKVSRIKINQI